MNSIEKVNKICKSVRSLTEADFQEISDLAERQVNYMHPLKGEKQNKLNALGHYNIGVIAGLRVLKEAIAKKSE